MEWKMGLWFVGMWIVGGFIYTLFGMQITITNKCAMKLYTMLKNETAVWYPDACLLYFKKVKRRNSIIIAIVFTAACFFIPLIGLIGFAVGFVLKRLTTARTTGMTDTNLNESAIIFQRFAKPGMEDQFEETIFQAIHRMQSDGIFNRL